jgi:hypothetical protein
MRVVHGSFTVEIPINRYMYRYMYILGYITQPHTLHIVAMQHSEKVSKTRIPNATKKRQPASSQVSVRYFGPKQRKSMAVRSHGYTDWITVDSVADRRPGV